MLTMHFHEDTLSKQGTKLRPKQSEEDRITAHLRELSRANSHHKLSQTPFIHFQFGFDPYFNPSTGDQ